MFFTKINTEEIPDVKAMIGHFDKNIVVQEVRLGIDENRPRKLHEWSYIGIRFTSDVSHVDIIRYLVKCQGDDFMGINNNYYILWFD